MNEQTLKLLEKALLASPDDWETRSHLIEQYLALNRAERAAELVMAAPAIPDTEANALLKARVELETDLAAAQTTLQGILAKNRACAQAYLLLARLFQKRGMADEARKKYGAATVIDESLSDPELEGWLGLEPTAPPRPPQPVPAQRPTPPPPLPRPAPPPSAIPASEMGDAKDPEDEAGQTENPQAMAVSKDQNEPPSLIAEIEMPKVTFHDIGGMEDVIERIRMNIIYPFKNPEVFQKFKKRPGGGILMYGPPGCGKTHIARATAGECGAVFMAIAITDILSKWVGESEQRLHLLFETARRRAPAVIFIDEIDAIGVNRAEASSVMAPLVNVLLTEMDGVAQKNENLMVLAATNAPWRVDNALRRPGRFDRVLFVPPPDEPARAAILKIHLREMPAEAVDATKIARLTERYSGADLRAVVERASEKAIFEEMKTGRPGKLTQRLLTDAIKEMRPSTNEWLETARSYATYANRSGLYDDLVAFFEKG